MTRVRVGFLASGLVAGAFFALVTVMAFRPRWLAGSVFEGGIVTLGLALTLAFLLLALGVMTAYVSWRGASE